MSFSRPKVGLSKKLTENNKLDLAKNREKIMNPIDVLEMAKIIGEPKDPRKPYPELISKICETESTDPEDFTYYFTSEMETEKIYVITSNGAVTQEYVSLHDPVLLTYVDVATPEYYVKLTDYLRKKEDVFARKNRTINRALNAEELRLTTSLLDSAADGSGKSFDLSSGQTRFRFPDLIDMIEQVQDFGDEYVFVTGAQVDKDLKLWDWEDNKYRNFQQAFSELTVDKVRISLSGAAATYQRDPDNSSGLSSVNVLDANKAFLVAKNTEMGKPLLFVRKKVDTIEQLGGYVTTNGDAPERVVFTSPNPVSVQAGNRYLAVGITGYEQIIAVVTNQYGICRFRRQ
jgi:hypothetical protein